MGGGPDPGVEVCARLVSRYGLEANRKDVQEELYPGCPDTV